MDRSLAPGSSQYRFRVTATDRAGNTGAATGQPFTLAADQEVNTTAIRYSSGWTQANLSGAYGGAVRHHSRKGASAIFTFTGRSIAWISTSGSNYGRAEVWLDGARVASLDLYNTSSQPARMVFSRNGLNATTTHRLEIRVLGSKNGNSAGTRIDVDAFISIR